MWERLRPYRWRVGGALSLVFPRIGLGLVIPFASLSVLDEALPQRDVAQLAILCGLIFVAGVLSNVIAVVQTAWIGWISQHTLIDLRLEMYDRVRAQPLDFHTTHSTSHLQTRLVSDVNGVDRFLSQSVRSGVSALAHATTAAIAIIFLCWPLAILSVLLTVGLIRLNHRFAGRRRYLARQRQECLSIMVKLISDDTSFSGTVLGRTSGSMQRQRRRFADVCDAIRVATYRQRVINSQALAIVSAMFACAPAGIYLLSGTLLSGLSIGTVVVLVTLLIRFTQPLQTLFGLGAGLQASVVMFERIMEYINLPAPDPVAKESPVQGPAELVLNGVSYNYDKSEKMALQDVDLRFPAGSITYLLGRTGSGKTTLGLVLAGLLPPTEGNIFLDGGNISAPEDLCERSVLVPQQVTLFDGSLADNLILFRESATSQEMHKALADADLAEFVGSLARGLDTHIGSEGLALSGGERQRLALARALLLDSGMLILDEVTSALDNSTAERVQHALRTERGQRTLVVITHRVPELASDDRVVVLDRGRVVEAGTHAELCQSRGAYFALRSGQGLVVPHQSVTALGHIDGSSVSALSKIPEEG